MPMRNSEFRFSFDIYNHEISDWEVAPQSQPTFINTIIKFITYGLNNGPW